MCHAILAIRINSGFEINYKGLNFVSGMHTNISKFLRLKKKKNSMNNLNKSYKNSKIRLNKTTHFLYFRYVGSCGSRHGT